MITMIACNSTKQKDTQTSTTIDSTLQVKATSILENKLTELNACLLYTSDAADE